MPKKREKQRLYERPKIRNVFDWLDEVRKRPSMWIGDGGLRELETLVQGYQVALYAHHLDEGVPEMGRHFSAWLTLKKRWEGALGWAYVIEEHAKRNKAQPLDVFFELVDAYRELRPVVRCHVTLSAKHSPTGLRCIVGADRSLPAPLKIEVVQYQPARLHFLRFHYAEGHENQNVLLVAARTGLSPATTVRDAKRWAEAEFRVQPGEWVDVPSSA